MISAFFVTATIFPLSGLGVSRLLQLSTPRALVARVAMFMLLGIGANGSIFFSLGICGVRLTSSVFLIVPLLLFLSGFLRKSSPISVEAPCHSQVATLLLLAPTLSIILSAAILPFADYDGRVTWLPKAAAIAAEQSVYGEFFRGERGLNLHNHYPLLLPMNAAAVLKIAGTDEVDAARWIYAVFPLATFLFWRDVLARHFPGPAAGWLFALLAWFPMTSSTVDGGPLSGYSDLAVMAFFGSAVFSILAEDSHSAQVWLTFLVFTKNEGIALVLVAIASALICRPRAGWRNALKLTPAPALAMFLLAVWRNKVPNAYDEQYSVLLSELPQNLGRFDDALIALGSEALEFRTWGLFWIVAGCGAAMSLAMTLSRVRRPPPSPHFGSIPAMILLLAFFAYVTTLSVTSWNIGELVKVAGDRLMLHLLAPGVLMNFLVWKYFVASLTRRFGLRRDAPAY